MKYEFNNLASESKHAATVAELKALVMKNWANEYMPLGEGSGANGKGKNAKGK
ncbi:MAG: hypothetical protein WCN98_07090 [Verrucomicrobiaceae bacterium]